MASSIWENAFIHVPLGQRMNHFHISGEGIALCIASYKKISLQDRCLMFLVGVAVHGLLEQLDYCT